MSDATRDPHAADGQRPQSDAAARAGAATPTSIDQPSGEVEHPAGAARLPGARREGYSKLPTGPVGIEPVVATGPDIDAADEPEWVPSTGAAPVDDTRLAPWALLAAIVALGASFFVGWGIPVAIVAVIAAVMSLRRPVESRAIARWALVLGLVATLYSAGWLIWAAMQFEVLG
ncbi:hypothetical protein SRABI76_02691 [Microbacterium oxydans]|uniref:DUF4190 domain-containing protein n=1 Tax=Microbacterium oxydans TaxID=82380 RepID=A0A0F0LAL2_9MICO|nr:hypothetical protein [Microbacterium oxydans]KJL29325.1 hypothetical protein RS83_01954 [Microbacterium oxydans]CAH0228530.1 hypothetical protein SRABI76_02691 [Microbacterium oxydans]